ncbi:MAG: SpoIIE family protein phosphatase [Bacteroidota bacterium]
MYDANSKKKWILWNSSIDENGNVVSVGYDITSRKKNEAKLRKANLLLERKNKEILDSLKYAQSIQHAFLPSKTFFEDKFTNGFVFYLPKDFVSGDFYWAYEFEDLYFVACIDCTGHGVPGALMTILANSMLKNVVKHQKLKDPAEILFALDVLLYEEFNKNNKMKRSDGMDISLCVFNFEERKISFSGANQSLFFKRNERVIQEFKGQRFPIGLYHDVEKKFLTQEISFEKGDKVFMLSDGFLDQFGGDKNKKFTKKNFVKMVEKSQSMSEMKHNIDVDFINWKGVNEQTDDVLVLGLEF